MYKAFKSRPLQVWMWNEPSDTELAKLPRIYASDHVPLEEVVIHQHFFLGGSDWYMAEYDPRDRLFFGYAILNNDLVNAEWGYTSYDELRGINLRGLEVDRDLHWKRTRVRDIERIRTAYEK